MKSRILLIVALSFALPAGVRADELPVIRDVEGQPLGQNVLRLLQALEFLGSPLPADAMAELKKAATDEDVKKIQTLLDPQVLLAVSINPEARVKIGRGPAEAVIQQHGYTPVLLKIINESTVKKRMHLTSPQSGP